MSDGFYWFFSGAFNKLCCEETIDACCLAVLRTNFFLPNIRRCIGVGGLNEPHAKNIICFMDVISISTLRDTIIAIQFSAKLIFFKISFTTHKNSFDLTSTLQVRCDTSTELTECHSITEIYYWYAISDECRSYANFMRVCRMTADNWGTVTHVRWFEIVRGNTLENLEAKLHSSSIDTWTNWWRLAENSLQTRNLMNRFCCVKATSHRWLQRLVRNVYWIRQELCVKFDTAACILGLRAIRAVLTLQVSMKHIWKA